MRLRNLAQSTTLGLLVLAALLVALSLSSGSSEAQALPSSSSASVDVSMSISQALAYIHSQQLPDGGINAFGFGSDEGGTARGVLALAAAGRSVYAMEHVTSGLTMMDYLAARAVTYTHDVTGTTSAHLFPDRAGLLLAAAAAADADPASFGGMDLIGQLEATYHPATGAYSSTARGAFQSGAAGTLNQAWAILGLAATGAPVPDGATGFLANLQEADGGWGSGFGTDADTTALAVVALLSSGNVAPSDVVILDALAYFRDTQSPGGGWAPAWDPAAVNADTTGWVMQALFNVGYTLPMHAWAGESLPHEALLSLQQPDGSIGGTYVNAYGTIEALFGLTEQPLFFLGSQHRALRALTWVGQGQAADGSWPTFFGHPAGPTADAVLAFTAARFDADTIMASGSMTSAMDYLSSTASVYVAVAPDAAGKLALAVEAAGEDAHDFGGVNIVNVLNATWYSSTLGAFGVLTNTWHQAFPILGLAAAGEPIPAEATNTLLDLQQDDGGWMYDLGPYSFASTADSTGLALQALIAAGIPPTDTSIVSATAFLATQQTAQGGWGNPNSTAFAMQGLLAAGEDLLDWVVDGRTPRQALVAAQKIDGPFTSPFFGATDNDFATRQAIPALLSASFPYIPTTLMPFAGVDMGPDPDRLVAAQPRPAWGGSVHVTVPFGSDLNSNGDVELEWRPVGTTTWMTVTTHRAEGHYTATLPVTAVIPYEFQATFQDAEGVQYESTPSGSVLLPPVTLEPFYVHLPLVMK